MAFNVGASCSFDVESDINAECPVVAYYHGFFVGHLYRPKEIFFTETRPPFKTMSVLIDMQWKMFGENMETEENRTMNRFLNTTVHGLEYPPGPLSGGTSEELARWMMKYWVEEEFKGGPVAVVDHYQQIYFESRTISTFNLHNAFAGMPLRYGPKYGDPHSFLHMQGILGHNCAEYTAKTIASELWRIATENSAQYGDDDNEHTIDENSMDRLIIDEN